MSTLLDCTNEWYINMDRGFYNLACRLSGFKESLRHGRPCLLAKLQLYGITDTAFNLFKSYLADRLLVM
jgi:hypothetical protein